MIVATAVNVNEPSCFLPYLYRIPTEATVTLEANAPNPLPANEYLPASAP